MVKKVFVNKVFGEIIFFCVLSHLSFVTLLVFEFCHTLSFLSFKDKKNGGAFV